MADEPLFSIVIPTRNRVGTLAHALRSALEQPGNDYEVIVSDNHSTDGTGDLLAQQRAPQLTLIRPERALGMSAHWNWAVAHARGQWVLILADDDAYCPACLPTLRSAIRRVETSVFTWHTGRYFHNVPLDYSNPYLRLYYDPERRNHLEVYSFAGGERQFAARTQLEALFAFREDLTMPRGHNSAIRRDLLISAAGPSGRLFRGLCPDYACVSQVLAKVSSYTFIDQPLQLWGSLPRGGTQSFGEQLAAEHGNGVLSRLPLHSARVVTNLIADTLLEMLEARPDELGSLKVDWVQYFRCASDAIRDLEKKGLDATVEKEELAAALRNQSASIRREVESSANVKHPRLNDALQRLRQSNLATTLRRRLYGSPRASRLIHRIRCGDQPGRWIEIFDGARFGFSNIYEATLFTATLPSIPRRPERPWDRV